MPHSDSGTDPGTAPGDGTTDPVVNRSAPSITNLRPVAGAKVLDRTPRVSAVVRDPQTDLAKSHIRVYIDGKMTQRFSYPASKDSVSGVSRKLKANERHTVRIVASDGAGKTFSKTSRFVSK